MRSPFRVGSVGIGVKCAQSIDEENVGVIDKMHVITVDTLKQGRIVPRLLTIHHLISS